MLWLSESRTTYWCDFFRVVHLEVLGSVAMVASVSFGSAVFFSSQTFSFDDVFTAAVKIRHFTST